MEVENMWVLQNAVERGALAVSFYPCAPPGTGINLNIILALFTSHQSDQ
jgi:hypothetical protein